MSNITCVLPTECTGCALCADICPKKCIRMSPDKEGFLCPEVDKAACVDCSRCTTNCPALNHELHAPSCGFVARSTLSTSQRSSSGGMAYSLSRKVIESGGSVVACALDNEGIAKHIIVEDVAALRAIQGSKYVQSDVRGAYSNVGERLKQGRKVLFVGTPCQVAAVENTFGSSPFLFTADLICHGVPSPAFWTIDLKKQNERGRLKAHSSIMFRNHSSYSSTSYELSDDISKHAIPYEKDAFFASFIRNASLRESCYLCPFACHRRAGDITLGDCATHKEHIDFYQTVPVSSVLINTVKGKTMWEELVSDGDISFEVLDITAESLANKQLSAPAVRPVERDRIYDDLSSMPWNEFEMRYVTKVSFSWYVKRFLKTLIPVGSRVKIRKLLRGARGGV